MVSLKFKIPENRTTEGGESNICKSYLTAGV